MEPAPVDIEHQPHESGNFGTVLVDNGASGHCFDDLITPDLKNCLQDYTYLSMLHTILLSGGSLLGGAAESVLQGLITDDYGEQHLARIAILFVRGVGCHLFSAKTSARRGIVSIYDVNKTQAGDGRPLCG